MNDFFAKAIRIFYEMQSPSDFFKVGLNPSLKDGQLAGVHAV